ncbi:tRNA nucleotidyltransferase [[Bacillus] enclensis]|uniref:CCA-adding enzyme n=1 Tax=[Bacillus] enclensis TaxID=1402860 RepID=A0A0V8HLX3_9BACI|nr:CCA tRNA nucleotidyltransferase [[Bacillus] enclensis]KSU63448.1 tRNA nucleotidyltransferase [[Bacillus] enclensis]SCB84127.1 tRNA nucleotidyltransferase (CCA-adding enzyme) [[Bacillus] enclensis]
MLPKIFQDAIPLLKKIEQAGYQAFFVGGSVRDYLLGRPINDVDIATSAFPDEIKSIFPRTADIGIEHGTILVIEKKNEYEITTFRTESGYGDFRRPDRVKFIRSLEADLMRRDFTMNSMAMDADGVIYDPFDGRDDIKQKLIRTVGEPAERFSEDALRMLRGVRFVSQLGFELETGTRKALTAYSNLLSHIAIERKTIEFEKTLSGDYRDKALEILIESALYKQLPGLSEESEAIRKIAGLPLVKKLSTDQMWLLLTAGMDIDPSVFLKMWRLPSKVIKERNKEKDILSRRIKEGWTRELLFRSGLERAVNVEKVYNCIHSLNSSTESLQEKYKALPIKDRKELKVTGNDLMNWSEKAGGPWVKETLEGIEKAILNEEIPNDHDTIRRWLETCNPSEKN